MRSAIADWDTKVAVQYHRNVSIDVRHKSLYKLHQKIQKCKMFSLRLPNGWTKTLQDFKCIYLHLSLKVLPPKLITLLRFINLDRDYYGLNRTLEVKNIRHESNTNSRKQEVPWFRKYEFQIRRLGYIKFTLLRQLLKKSRCLPWMILTLDK